MHPALQLALSQVKDAPAIHLEATAPDYPQLIAQYLPAPIHVVCDINTRRDLPYHTLCFAESPKPTVENIKRIRNETSAAKALVAVGSGTINDLVKYAAFLDGKPYLVIASAPSMNGYVSANASILVDGAKQSLSARGPVAVLADLPTLTRAPLPLIQAGIGDTLCRSTVQADWLLAHLLKEVPYEPMYFEWLREHETILLTSLRAERSNPEHDAQHWIATSPSAPRNDEHIRTLFETLLISGLAMRHHGTSMPASQGEHMIAHTRESLFPDLPSHFHGLEIAVTTLTMSEIQDKILASDALPSEIRAAISAIRLPTTTLRAALAAAGCPTSPEDLGWPEASYQKAIAQARFSRDRFTFLELQETP